jgi:hypothetical protein
MKKRVPIFVMLGFAALALVFVRVVGRIVLARVAVSVDDKR